MPEISKIWIKVLDENEQQSENFLESVIQNMLTTSIEEEQPEGDLNGR